MNKKSAGTRLVELADAVYARLETRGVSRNTGRTYGEDASDADLPLTDAEREILRGCEELWNREQDGEKLLHADVAAYEGLL